MKVRTKYWDHLPEYLIEAGGLGLFMVSACVFGALLEYPGSPVREALADAFVRRVLMGAAMGLTAVALIYSPWGKRSGAHFNPAVTLTYFRLGKIATRDAVGYIVAQFVGGTLGVVVPARLLGRSLADPAVNYVATVPGSGGAVIAFGAEVIITAILMGTVLVMSNQPKWARFTGIGAGVCLLGFIAFEAPLSGMSLNPARTLASAVVAADWRALWIYFVAPPLGMFLAAAVYTATVGRARVACAKLHHDNPQRCIFCEHHRGRA